MTRTAVELRIRDLERAVVRHRGLELELLDAGRKGSHEEILTAKDELTGSRKKITASIRTLKKKDHVEEWDFPESVRQWIFEYREAGWPI